MSETINVAVAQFAVGKDIAQNAAHIIGLVEEASAAGAEIVQFPEAALSGYGGADVESYREGFDWEALWAATEKVQKVTKDKGLTVLLGSTHFVDDETPPTNCVYVIDAEGQIADRYDKRMLTFSDQLFYTAGDHDVVFERAGQTFAIQVCYDICYPALYSRLAAQGVGVVFHCFYNAGFDDQNILDVVGPAWNIARAADNRLHICASNAARPHQNWPSMITRPDGSIAQQAVRNERGLLLHRFPDDEREGWEHNFRPFLVHPDEELSMGQRSEHPRVQDRQAPARPTDS